MSNELAIPTNLPAYLQDYESDSSDSLISSGVSLPRISLKGKQFRFKIGDKEKALPLGTALPIVILGAAPAKGFSKAFYESAYVDGSDDPPDCSSSDGIEPDSWVDSPVRAACATCPNNQWGSGHDAQGDPSKGKACSDIKKLLVLPYDNPEADIFVLQVPPASLKSLSSFGNKLKNHKIPIEGIVTKLSFAEEAFPKLEFNFASFIDEALAPRFLLRAQSEEVAEIMLQAVAEEKSVTDAVDPGENQEPAGEYKEPIPKTGVEASLELNDGSYSTDKTGARFDDSIHSRSTGHMGGHLTKDGVFAKRRNAKAKVAPIKEVEKAVDTPEDDDDIPFGAAGVVGGGATEPTEEASVADAELNSILENWGS